MPAQTSTSRPNLITRHRPGLPAFGNDPDRQTGIDEDIGDDLSHMLKHRALRRADVIATVCPMVQIDLRPMTQKEYDDWRPGAVASYAAEHVRAGSMPADRAQEMAEKQFADLLPDGVSTTEHHLLSPQINQSTVGFLWLHIPQDVQRSTAFIYDIAVEQHQRGRGIGRAIMLAGENYARDRGAEALRLHVFGDNTAARNLYGSLGYQITNLMMSKSLDTPHN